MTDVVSFDAHKVRRYLDQAINAFFRDPPDSPSQRGYLSALVCVYREALGKSDDRLDAADRMTFEPGASHD